MNVRVYFLNNFFLLDNYEYEINNVLSVELRSIECHVYYYLTLFSSKVMKFPCSDYRLVISYE